MKLLIRGKKKLQGTVKISGSKNSALAIICASLLSDEEVIIRNVPQILDVKALINIIEDKGYPIYFKNNVFKIKPLKKINNNFLSLDISKLRGSCYLMGSCLGKYKQIKVTTFGGCNLGKRPINYHLDGFKKMNVSIKKKNNIITLKTRKLLSANIKLPFPSVGATINLILAAVKASGITTIENAALEPEVADLGNFLISMGAKITGLSTNKITITGVKYLHFTDYIISSDRIEAGTYLILGAMCKGSEIILENIKPYYLKKVIDVLIKSGCKISCGENSIIISGNNSLKAIQIDTDVYPNFPTDLGPIISILMTQIKGISTLKETIFENRFSHIEEIKKANAEITNINNYIFINGGKKLTGAKMTAYDLRGAAALVLCGVVSTGITTIDNIDVLFRGYENPIEKLKKLGLNVTLIK